jgi:hypothetical protein
MSSQKRIDWTFGISANKAAAIFLPAGRTGPNTSIIKFLKATFAQPLALFLATKTKNGE